MNYIITTTDGEYLQHYGILGQKWGVRRFQNQDGTLTEAGKKRYGNIHESSTYTNKHGETIKYSSTDKQKDYNRYGKKGEERIEKRLDSGEYRTYKEAQKPEQTRQNKKALAIGLSVSTLAIMSPVLIADLSMGKDSEIINAGKNLVKGINTKISAKKFMEEVFENSSNMGFEEIVNAAEYDLKNHVFVK